MELHGGNGADVLNGTAGDDVLYGFGGNDTLKGGAGNDVLAGHEGNDKLYGGDGDDYLLGGPGNDLIDGGAGNDWAAYEDATSGVTVSLAITGPQNTGGGGTDTLANIENLYGSAFNDTLTGDAHDNYIYGGDGDDSLRGGAGNDHLSGGKGVNIIDGGDGFDTVDYAFSDKGVVVDIHQVAPSMGAPWTHDWYFSIEAVMGSAYDDQITGNDDENYLFGDKGNDILRAVNGHDTLDGGEGADTLYASDQGGDLLIGGQGRDEAHGGAGVDTFLFHSGDTAWTKTAADLDVIVGFQAQDKLLFDGVSPEAMITATAASWAEVYASAAYALGHAGVLTGHPIVAVAAYQVGADTYVVTSDPNSPDHALFAVKLTNFTATNLSLANFGDDTLTGTDGADVLHAAHAGQTVDGGKGADTLYASEEGNVLIGGQGRDEVHGGAGADTFVFNSGDTAWSSKAADIDVVVGFQTQDKIQFTGVAPQAMITATAASWAEVYASAAYALGHAGVLDGHPVTAVAAYQVGADTFVVTADPGSSALFAIKLTNVTAGDLTLANFGAGNLVGGDGADVLHATYAGQTVEGGAGADTLYATDGGNVLVGGLGRDELHGGAGADTFVFAPGDTTWSASQTDASVDVIIGFEADNDKLVFETDGVRYNAALSYREATSWLGAASIAPAEIHSARHAYIAVQVGDDTYVFASGPTTGSSMAAEHVVKLVGVHAADLTIANFG